MTTGIALSKCYDHRGLRSHAKDDKKSLLNYVHHLLADPTLGPALIARAQQEKPGRPMTGQARQASRVVEALTRQQKDFVKAVVLKEKWSKLSKKEQEHFYKADETDQPINNEIGGCIADAASSSVAPRAAQVPEIPCLKTSAATEVRRKRKRKHCQKTKRKSPTLYSVAARRSGLLWRKLLEKILQSNPLSGLF